MSVALIIGAGPRVGQSLAQGFAKAGYKVAIASRTAKDWAKDYKHFPVDLAQPAEVPKLFEEVSQSLGVPSVVIFNAAAADMTKPDQPLSTGVEKLAADSAVNISSSYISASEAVKGFEKLSSDGKLGQEGATFIFTGNSLSVDPLPMMVSFGMFKAGVSNMIQLLATKAYQGKPYKFYYGDERKEDGQPAFMDLSGPAHAEHYLKLAQEPQQMQWQQTFVKGKGYVKF